MVSKRYLLLLAGVFVLGGILSLGFADSYAVSINTFEDACGLDRSIFFDTGSGDVGGLLVPPLLSVTQPGIPESLFGGIRGDSPGDVNNPCKRMRKECNNPMAVGEDCVKCLKKTRTEKCAKKLCKAICEDLMSEQCSWDWTKRKQCKAGVG